MCGRFALRSDKTHIEAHYGLADAPAFSAGYNIAPSSHIPIIRNHNGKELVDYHWGLIPHWAKDSKL